MEDAEENADSLAAPAARSSEDTQDIEGRQSAQQSCEVVVLIGRDAREVFLRFYCDLVCGADGRVSGAASRGEVTLEGLLYQRAAVAGGLLHGSFWRKNLSGSFQSQIYEEALTALPEKLTVHMLS